MGESCGSGVGRCGLGLTGTGPVAAYVNTTVTFEFLEWRGISLIPEGSGRILLYGVGYVFM